MKKISGPGGATFLGLEVRAPTEQGDSLSYRMLTDSEERVLRAFVAEAFDILAKKSARAAGSSQMKTGSLKD